MSSLNDSHPLTARPRSLWDKITGTSRMSRPSYGPRGEYVFDDEVKKKKSGTDMLKSAMQKLSGASSFKNPNAGKFPKSSVKAPAYRSRQKPFKPSGPTSNGIGVGP